MLRSLSGLVQPGDEVAFFLRAAFALQYIGAIAPEPFLDLCRIGEALRVRRRRQRLDALADTGAPGLFRIGGVAAGAAHLLAAASRMFGAVQRGAARGGQGRYR